ncbi:hypothetical protein [Georgenia muralis]
MTNSKTPLLDAAADLVDGLGAKLDDVEGVQDRDTLGQRGRNGDPLHGIQTMLRAGAENLTDK